MGRSSMFEQMKERLDELRKKWWFGKWASIAYAGSLILFAIYCQMQEGTLGQKVLLVLLGVCFCSGLILAYLQNSKPVLIAVNYGQEEVSQEEYARIIARLIGNNEAESLPYK